MPFLRPGDVPRVDEADDPYMAGIEALYRQAFEVASEKRENGQTIIAMGHCHMTGSQTSDDSERRIVVGGAEALSASIFDEGIGYVALGHLHLPQKIKGDRRKTETLKLIESKIGLTFDQFTRAVLLAQNDFSTFLKANDDERAELLQTLTGTHTFSEISKQAFVRMRDEKAALDQLREQMANQAPWTLEVRVDKEAKHAQHIEQQKGLDKSKNDTESWLRWYEQLTKQKALDADAGQRVEQATAARVAAKERCVVLARIEEVQPARPLFAEQERLAKEIVTTEKTVNERQRELGLAVKTVEV